MTRQTLALDPAMVDFFTRTAWREAPALAALRAETATHRLAKMQLAPEQGALLDLLLKLIGARRYIEAGTFTGYSALTAALAMGEGSEVVACDVSREFTALAEQHWQRAGVAERIKLVLQPALNTFDALLAQGQAGSFDCVLIDADKPGYPAYYERALQLLRVGGLIVLDNMFLGGRVATPTADEPPGVGIIRMLNQQLHADERIDLCVLPIGDGMTLARKR
ncbi:class I SAM-dependent methyltransferase [Amantichitinum ursilacus]|uniref:Putative O-methyltransferase n=1 Tax=Amantichitinum ursilacus TaxID=857265 RepID=A0A0N0XHB8_9NEIS|nr:class I SAM-dependent methyltransferase [Amantichitinum ursilacus]KPC49358.1 putative O-methyltransferase [Amantichitinum ursilacus]